MKRKQCIQCCFFCHLKISEFFQFFTTFFICFFNSTSNYQLAIGSCLVRHEKLDDTESVTVTVTNSPKKLHFWHSFVRRLPFFSNTSPTTERTTTNTTIAEDGFDNFALENHDEIL